MKKLPIAAALIPIALILTGCGTSSKASGPAQDGIGQMACDHFRDVMTDAGNGILSDAELRNKMKEVYSDSIGSTTASITLGARSVLADVTQGDAASYVTDVGALSDSCKIVGH